MENGFSITFLEARLLRQVVGKSGGHQQFFGIIAFAPAVLYQKMSCLVPPRSDDFFIQFRDAIFFQLAVGELQEIPGKDIIPCQVVMHSMRVAVTVLLRVEQQNLSTRPSQHNCGIQPCGTTANNDTVIELHNSGLATN